MSGPKKHPLEIFRSAGRKFGESPPGAGQGDAAGAPPTAGAHGSGAPAAAPTESSPPAESGEPGESRGGPPQRLPSFAPARRDVATREFELRLSLPGTAILLFVWLVLMGGSYIFGYHRGEDASKQRDDAQALENGKNLENTGGSPADPNTDSPAADADSALPFGVPVGTYRTNQEALLEETRRTLSERYGIDVFNEYVYEKAGKVVLFAGVFASKDDPQLKSLEVKLRNIKDYPTGDKAPFRAVKVDRHPNAPAAYPSGYTGPRADNARDDSH